MRTIRAFYALICCKLNVIKYTCVDFFKMIFCLRKIQKNTNYFVQGALKLNQLVRPGRKLSQRQLMLAIIITLISVIISYLCWGLGHAQSALVGGAIGIIPNFVFGLYAFKYAGANASKQVMDSFFKGAKIKMVLTALLFALSFKFLSLSLVPFFVTYILAVTSPLVYVAATRFTFNQL